jgi:hypothetical protein
MITWRHPAVKAGKAAGKKNGGESRYFSWGRGPAWAATAAGRMTGWNGQDNMHRAICAALEGMAVGPEKTS